MIHSQPGWLYERKCSSPSLGLGVSNPVSQTFTFSILKDFNAAVSNGSGGKSCQRSESLRGVVAESYRVRLSILNQAFAFPIHKHVQIVPKWAIRAIRENNLKEDSKFVRA